MREHVNFRGNVLHVAPEACLRRCIQEKSQLYVTIDLNKHRIPDVRADVLSLPFADNVFDVVFMSHVLEHLPDYHAALREIVRVIRLDGTFVSDVPIESSRTCRTEPKLHPDGHCWSLGPDFLETYQLYFPQVRHFFSTGFSAEWNIRRVAPVTICEK